jgi:hypothetical protein
MTSSSKSSLEFTMVDCPTADIALEVSNTTRIEYGHLNNLLLCGIRCLVVQDLERPEH